MIYYTHIAHIHSSSHDFWMFFSKDSSFFFQVFPALNGDPLVFFVVKNLQWPGYKMPMCCTQAERRQVERILTGTKLRGTYLPLRHFGATGRKKHGDGGGNIFAELSVANFEVGAERMVPE